MPLTKILVIFNPVAGHKYFKGFKEYFFKQSRKFLPQTEFDWLETRPDLAGQLKQVELNNYQRLIVIGGDGTIKEAANFLLKNKIDLPLAILPQGSANILASSLNIPLTLNQAIKTACLGQQKKMDVGLLNGRYYFLICLSIGFWSQVVNETKRGLKIKLGFWAYLFTYFKQKRSRHNNFKFSIDGKAFQSSGNTLVVANALSLFKLKPKKPIDFYDGQFDIMVVKHKTFLGFLTMGVCALFNKRFLPFLFRDCGKKIIIQPSAKNHSVQIDGDRLELKELTVEISPKKLQIIA